MGSPYRGSATVKARLELMEEQLLWGVEHHEKLPVELEELFARWTAGIRQFLSEALGDVW